MKLLYIVMFIGIYLTSSAQDYFQFGAKEKYYLENSEKNLSIDSIVLLEYEPFNPDLIHQVPLNRYVKADNYKLYVGLAIFDLPQSLLDFYKNDPQCEILKSDKQIIKRDTYSKLLCKIDSCYVYKVVFLTRKSKYTVVFNYVCANYLFLESLYDDKNFINNKLKKSKKKLK